MSDDLDHAKNAMVKQEQSCGMVGMKSGGYRWAALATDRVMCDLALFGGSAARSHCAASVCA
jgi:hypothetical protein